MLRICFRFKKIFFLKKQILHLKHERLVETPTLSPLLFNKRQRQLGWIETLSVYWLTGSVEEDTRQAQIQHSDWPVIIQVEFFLNLFIYCIFISPYWLQWPVSSPITFIKFPTFPLAGNILYFYYKKIILYINSLWTFKWANNSSLERTVRSSLVRTDHVSLLLYLVQRSNTQACCKSWLRRKRLNLWYKYSIINFECISKYLK